MKPYRKLTEKILVNEPVELLAKKVVSMKRIPVVLRDDAEAKAHESGVFRVNRALENGETYKTWDESSAYVVTQNEVDTILDKVSSIVEMGREAVDFLLDGEWGTLGLTRPVFEYARNSFDDQEIEMFTRYDFAYLGNGQIKLVGIEADAPNLFVETAQSQRIWLWDKFGEKAKSHKITQLNSLPEMTINAFQQLNDMSETSNLHILDNTTSRGRDWIASSLIKNMAERGGWNVGRVRLKDLEWDPTVGYWTDGQRDVITNLYKQFPWDMLLSHGITRDFIAHSGRLERTFEPAWKTILGNRAMLPALHELFPHSALVSPAALARSKKLGENIVAAPLSPSISRNEVGVLKGRKFTSWGEDVKDFKNQKNMVYRKLEIPKRYKEEDNESHFAYLSVFTVAGNIAGLGVQETKLPLLGLHSTFKPHIVML